MQEVNRSAGKKKTRKGFSFSSQVVFFCPPPHLTVNFLHSLSLASFTVIFFFFFFFWRAKNRDLFFRKNLLLYNYTVKKQFLITNDLLFITYPFKYSYLVRITLKQIYLAHRWTLTCTTTPDHCGPGCHQM